MMVALWIVAALALILAGLALYAIRLNVVDSDANTDVLTLWLKDFQRRTDALESQQSAQRITNDTLAHDLGQLGERVKVIEETKPTHWFASQFNALSHDVHTIRQRLDTVPTGDEVSRIRVDVAKHQKELYRTEWGNEETMALPDGLVATVRHTKLVSRLDALEKKPAKKRK